MKPIKYLGQNFLTSKKIVEDIVRAADLKPDDIVLEVGPGKGILTEAILEKIPQGKLIAVEKDKRLVEYLNKKFENIPKSYDREKVAYAPLKIINDDILKFNFTRYGLHVTRYKIVANIPYYITSRFLRNFLQSNFQPVKMVLMLQKEVAERIVAPSTSLRAGKESILSISVKVYGEPKIIKKVPARYFSPKPKVDSAILVIDNISNGFWSTLNVDQFFGLVKQGFSSKRKLLKNNLNPVRNKKLKISADLLRTNRISNGVKLSNTRCLTECGIKENARAEDLSLKDWKCLYEKIFT